MNSRTDKRLDRLEAVVDGAGKEKPDLIAVMKAARKNRQPPQFTAAELVQQGKRRGLAGRIAQSRLRVGHFKLTADDLA